MNLMQLVYVSSARAPFNKTDLLDLLQNCRSHNAASGVTGLLLYKDGNFLQVLEGDEPVIEALFAHIQLDRRHSGVLLLLFQPLAARDFPDWTMAFHDLQDRALHDLPGFSEFLNAPFDADAFERDPSKARRLIGIFKANMR